MSDQSDDDEGAGVLPKRQKTQANKKTSPFLGACAAGEHCERVMSFLEDYNLGPPTIVMLDKLSLDKMPDRLPDGSNIVPAWGNEPFGYQNNDDLTRYMLESLFAEHCYDTSIGQVTATCARLLSLKKGAVVVVVDNGDGDVARLVAHSAIKLLELEAPDEKDLVSLLKSSMKNTRFDTGSPPKRKELNKLVGKIKEARSSVNIRASVREFVEENISRLV